jgi:phosphoribosylamine---glycine ligase
MADKSVLIVGSGGREHALAWKLAQSPRVARLFVAPGNAGTEQLDKTQNVAIAATDVAQLIDFAKANGIDCIVVGPEAALAEGITDKVQQHNIPCLGPSKAAAMLEISKTFSKQFMQEHGIPTARYAAFNQLQPALDYIKDQSFPLVIKADGLAAGKGVIIAQDAQTAAEALTDMLENDRFGDAGQRVIIEEFLAGEELSFIALSDGENILPLATSRDHKHRFEGDTGPNTGGMGAYSPVPIDDTLQETIINDVMLAVVRGMKQVGTPYVGFLYAGLMLDKQGQPRVLEFNCRLGDPETQPLLMRLESDLYDLIESTLNGKLDACDIAWSPKTALTVVLAANGYPGDYSKGTPIAGLNTPCPEGSFVFHAGTKRVDNQVVTAGGRVLGVTALGDSLLQAQQKAYALCQQVAWEGCAFRSDIGWRGIQA